MKSPGEKLCVETCCEQRKYIMMNGGRELGERKALRRYSFVSGLFLFYFFRVRFPTLFRTHPSATVHNPTRIRIFKRYDWSRISILQEEEEVFSTVCSKKIHSRIAFDYISKHVSLNWKVGWVQKSLSNQEHHLWRRHLASDIYKQDYSSKLLQ